MALKLPAALCLLALAAAPAAGADGADALFQEGVSLQQKGDYSAAVDRYSRALLLRPSDRRIQEGLSDAGRRLMEQDDQIKRMSVAELSALVEQAQRILDNRRRQMADALERLKLAQTESQLADPQSLLRSCRGVDILMEVALGDDDESRRIKDYLHSLCGNLELSLQKGLIVQKAMALRVAGYIAFCRSDWTAAAEAWRHALAAAPQDARLRDLLARAEENALRAREIADAARLFLEAETLARAGRPAQAVPLLEQVLAKDPMHRSAILLLEECRRKAQDETLQAAILRRREQARAHERQGLVLEAAGAWLSLLELDPLDAEALAHLHRTRDALSRDLPSAPSAPRDEEKSRRLYTLGLIDYAEGRLKDAALRFERSLEADPSNDFARRAAERVRREMAP